MERLLALVSLAYFFTSDEAVAITGPAFSIDGGTLAWSATFSGIVRSVHMSRNT